MEETKMYVNGAYWKSMVFGPTDRIDIFISEKIPSARICLNDDDILLKTHKITFQLEDVWHCPLGGVSVKHRVAVCIDPGVYIDFRTGELRCHDKYRVKQVAQRYGLPVCENLPRKVSTIVGLLNSLEG